MEAFDDEDGGSVVLEMEEDLTSQQQYIVDYSIFRIPSNLRSGDDSFSPRVVSIGPLHHGKPKLLAMEKHKKWYLDNCLEYNPSITLAKLKGRLKGMEERVRHTYNQEHFYDKFSSTQFVNMMLMDGCFIIHLFLLDLNKDVAAKYDRAMFATDSLYKDVQYDLKLVENQLPFFLLDDMFDFILTDEQRGSDNFLSVTINYFHRYVKMGGNVFRQRNEDDFKHLGDVLLSCFLPSIPYSKPPSDSKTYDALPTASELHNLGVKFKKSESLNLLDITFRDGVLEIPKFRITGSARSTFRNMIAMEQCHPGSNTYVTDYMTLMNYLVDTKEDVGLLKSCEVIDSYAGNDEHVTEIFNTMTDGVIRSLTKDSHYYGIIHDINEYSHRPWNQWKASVKKDYFSSPLKVLSLIAAFALLVSTVLGTVFTVLSFTK